MRRRRPKKRWHVIYEHVHYYNLTSMTYGIGIYYIIINSVYINKYIYYIRYVVTEPVEVMEERKVYASMYACV